MTFVDVLFANGVFIAVLGVAAFLAREWIVKWIGASVFHDFERKLAMLEGELRERQAQVEAELRTKEAQIDALRGSALSSLVAAQTAVAQRRIAAADDLWKAVNDWNKLYFTVIMMQSINFENSSKLVAGDAKAKAFFEGLAGTLPDDWNLLGSSAASARPYISDLAWALYTAYQSILATAGVKLKLLASGIDGRSFFDFAAEKKLLVAALPDWKDYIEKNGVLSHQAFLDVLRDRLVGELRNTIDGKAQDSSSIIRAAEILKLATSVNRELQKGVAATEESVGV